MKQIVDFFKGLFDTDLWPPRWQCGDWSDFHGWLYIISDLMIWTAYFLIPAIILNYTSRRRPDLKFPKVYFLFAAFILLCGTTHFLDAGMFWIPMYRLNALVRFITGVVSLFTVYHLIKILPDAFKQKTNLELEKEIARREEAERKLATANRGLEEFAYMASHDLKEPLRKVRIYTSMLSDLNKNSFDEKSKELSDKVLQSSENMQNIIEGILSLSTINDKIEINDLSIEEIIKKAKEDLEIKIVETNALIHVGSIPHAKGNRVYLVQLFSNLIANAIKFSKEKPIIHITGEQRGNKILIHVADNGIGISKPDADKIFEPFQRLNAKKNYEGSGIGLAICKRIIEVHNGSISVESIEGQGTTFTIELFVAQKEKAVFN